jgi:hypothetical protein
MIINTDIISYEKAARLIGDAVIHHFQTPVNAHPPENLTKSG